MTLSTQVLEQRDDGWILFDPPITLEQGGTVSTFPTEDKILVVVEEPA